MAENNEEVVVDAKTNEGESGAENEGEFVKVPKADYDKLNQTLGSLKRENKDLKKPKDTEETPEKTKPNENALMEKAFLRTAGISKATEVELALETAKKWGVGIDALVDDSDFQVKLEKLRTQESNTLATSGVKGTGTNSQAKNSVEYYMAKGQPPTATDIPDNALRRKVAKEFLTKFGKSGGKTFYND